MGQPAIAKDIGITDSRFHLPYIDGLRGVAVLMVLAVHSSNWAGNVHSGSFHFHTVELFVNAGARGVQLFFMLSAFTLFSSSRVRFQSDLHPCRSFYIRRAFRILPFWWLTNAVYLIRDGKSWSDALPAFLLYFGLIRFRPGTELFPLGWSVFVEETFYLLLPLLFFYFKDLIHAVWFLVWTLALAYCWPLAASWLAIPDERVFVFLFPFSHWFAFALGILMYFLVNHPGLGPQLRDEPRLVRLLNALAVIAIVGLLPLGYMTATFGLFAFFLAAIPAQGLIGRFARQRWLMRMGTYCYSIYLAHFLILDALDPLRARLFSLLELEAAAVEIRFLVWFPCVALASMGVGAAMFYTVERPCVRLGKRVIAWLDKRSGPGRPPEPAATPEREIEHVAGGN